MKKVAVMLDGGFVRKKIIESTRRHFPTVADVQEIVQDIMSRKRLSGSELFRVYWYDAPPIGGTEVNPLSGAKIDFSTTLQSLKNRQLLEALELEPDFAVRHGQLICSGWKLGRTALRDLSRHPRPLVDRDLVPNIQQKGVDIRIGLDIASIATKRLVDEIVLVTGDSDFVPAMKLARREGLKVSLMAMGHGIRRELKAHADFVF